MHMVARPVVVMHILTRCNDAVVMLEHGTRHNDFHNDARVLYMLYLLAFGPREDAGVFSREYVLRIPSVS